MRDVKYLGELGRVATLAVDGTCHVWDPHLTSISRVRRAPELGAACLAAVWLPRRRAHRAVC